MSKWLRILSTQASQIRLIGLVANIRNREKILTHDKCRNVKYDEHSRVRIKFTDSSVAPRHRHYHLKSWVRF